MRFSTEKLTMKETYKKILTTIVLTAVFIFSVVLITQGRMNTGALGLLTQLVGLAGLLFLLWNYNRKFR